MTNKPYDGHASAREAVRRLEAHATRMVRELLANVTECSYCSGPGARMGDPFAEPYDPCVGEPICDPCRNGLTLDPE